MSEETIPLKRCPFCGSQAAFDVCRLPQRSTTFWNVYCLDCGAMTYPYNSSMEQAAKRWNDRRKNRELED